jgi:hypothetical protein
VTKETMQGVAMMYLFTIFTCAIVLRGFCSSGFPISYKFQICLAVLMVLVFRFLFRDRKTCELGRKPYCKKRNRRRVFRRERDKLSALMLLLKILKVEVPEELTKKLYQCKNNFPKEQDRRKVDRRKPDDQSYTYALASL